MINKSIGNSVAKMVYAAFLAAGLVLCRAIHNEQLTSDVL